MTTNLRTIVSVSGGKDSVAACLHLREMGIEHERVFMDTGWEHPDLYAHLDYLEEVLGPITRLRAQIPDIPEDLIPEVEEIEALVGSSPSPMVRIVVNWAHFPGRMVRWCTRKLKVEPFLAWVEAMDEDIISVVGIRAEESRARARMSEREIMPGQEHIEVWRPLLRWTESEVIAIHHRHGVLPCPLYLNGASRVGCWPCIQSNKAQLALLAKDDRRVEALRRLEALVSIKDGNDKAFFQSRRPVDGRYPPLKIDDVMAWSQTQRGGRQPMLSADWGREAGCVRWGMCEGVKP